MSNSHHITAALLAFLFFFISFVSLFHPSSSQYLSPPPPSNFNPRLQQAYIALQAWKHSITDDPKNLTADWCGPHVCNYTGVFCAPSPSDPSLLVVAGIDLNHGKIAGCLPEDLGLLSDLALFHINSNRFAGRLPDSFKNLELLFELDVSNNRFSGPFPSVVLRLPALRYLDIRFNGFDGGIPDELFDLKLDAIFINNNKFQAASIPANLGNSPVSVVVLANNRLGGCLPRNLSKMATTLQEIILSNAGLTTCLPPELGALKNVTVFDVSFNSLAGPLPPEIGEMKSLQQLNVAHNQLSGAIPASICGLPKLENFTYSYNYFCEEPAMCLKLKNKDDRKNCIPGRPLQRPEDECSAFLSHPVHCDVFGCFSSSPAPAPLLSAPPPPYYYKP
ncbi:Leucine-rich repeat extensin-like protein 6 [Asimina triloba]